jgi:hypothetical protein
MAALGDLQRGEVVSAGALFLLRTDQLAGSLFITCFTKVKMDLRAL